MYPHSLLLLAIWSVWTTCLAVETPETYDTYKSTVDQSLNDLLPSQYYRISRNVQQSKPSDTLFITSTMPNDSRMHPTVGNGHIATVVLSDTICMNGIYNGATSTSHRARIPSVAGIKVEIPTNKSITQLFALDVQHGLFSHVNVVKNKGSVVETIYAHRKLKEVLVVEIQVNRSESYKEDFQVDLHMNYTSSNDLQRINDTLDFADAENVIYFHGVNTVSEEYDAQQKHVHMIYTNVPSKLILPATEKGKVYYFLTVLGTSKDQVVSKYREAKKLARMDTLMNIHADVWSDIWAQGNIEVSGDHQLARVTYAAQYYLLSSLPTTDKTDFIGLSPGGLTHGLAEDDYGGHVFWDQDIWMFPHILMFRSDLAKVLIKTRTRTLDAARARAAMNGHRGAMYPWESAQTGMETTNSIPVANYEQHVTGDIAFAAAQYLYMTNDHHFFKNERAGEMIESIADFWIYRVVLDKKSMKYFIKDVMGPDEYNYPVDNSIYTNYIAMKSLDVAIYVSKQLSMNFQREELYEIIKEDMYLPFDSKLKYHPEYDGYKPGETVKQADVILLGYPLMMDMSKAVRYNDLVRYGKVSDENGPAMTWSMFSIGWLEMNNITLANSYFEKNYGNVIGPFKMWSEYSNGRGAVNFLTGMGGFLQGLIFGYGGFRIHKDRLEFYPQLPLNANNVTLHNIDYRGNSFTLSFDDKFMSLRLTEQGGDKLIISLMESMVNLTFPYQKTMHIPIERVAIMVKEHKRHRRDSDAWKFKPSSFLLFLSFMFSLKFL